MIEDKKQAKIRHLIFWILNPLLCLVSFTLAQYSFDLSCLSDTLQVVAPNGVANFNFRLANIGSLNDVYELNCRVIESVPGWFETFCVRGLCVEPGIPMYDTLNVGQFDTAIHISVYTTSTQGREILSLNVRSLGDPTQKDSIRVYTQVGPGITENLALNLTHPTFEIYPNPAKSVIRIRFPSSVKDIRIYDITGKIVKSFSPNTQSLTSNHCLVWDGRDQTGQLLLTGSYIATFIHNGKAIISKRMVLIK
jgi:hypothetical protein